MNATGTGSADRPHAWLADARRVVVKIGSRALLDDDHHVDELFVASLVAQMSELHREGVDVVCVSSGAVAAGLGGLGLSRRPVDLPSLQAAAAVGQAALMELYRRLFRAHDMPVAQVLLTHADLRSRERQLNARNTFSRLLERGVIPIVNENDTVAVDEIRVGDNDLLSALVSVLLRADLLVMLTTADGLLTRPPEQGGELVREVDRITDAVRAMAAGAAHELGTGGMRTKIEAAEMVTRCGEGAIIAGARAPGILMRLRRGEPVGTVFRPGRGRLAGRKRWIAFFDHPRGALQLDAGAVEALTGRGASLLAVGIRHVEGRFKPGDPVRLLGPDGHEFARGLVNYPAEDVERIRGRASHEFARILGRCEYEEVVHRDNLVVG